MMELATKSNNNMKKRLELEEETAVGESKNIISIVIITIMIITSIVIIKIMIITNIVMMKIMIITSIFIIKIMMTR